MYVKSEEPEEMKSLKRNRRHQPNRVTPRNRSRRHQIGYASFLLYIKSGLRKSFKYQMFADDSLDKEVEMVGLVDT